MRQNLVDLLLVTTFVFSVNIKTVVSAELDITKLQCDGIDDKEDLASFAFWLDGYVSGINKASSITFTKIENLIEETIKACNQNPEKTVFEVVKKLKQ
ncbi:HdeA/HdeB family chaperone [Kiloniella antarctica]|uniref:HdeA/HdeB family chaperone n=1 Tax=Kiloniella antarctica TaxID=1550907 RepID=A0ABW5BS64_9PROT